MLIEIPTIPLFLKRLKKRIIFTSLLNYVENIKTLSTLIGQKQSTLTPKGSTRIPWANIDFF